jgi:hypothetical protein
MVQKTISDQCSELKNEFFAVSQSSQNFIDLGHPVLNKLWNRVASSEEVTIFS